MSVQVEGLAKGTNEIPTCHGGLENLNEEHSYNITEIEGELPKDLTGTKHR
jgi:carotenoid cleavage dioxygenase-like enzyme